MVALTSCGIDVPIVVIANKGQEADILQTFRLGAVDFLFCPVRETEVINVIENTLSKTAVKQRAGISLQKIRPDANHSWSGSWQIFPRYFHSSSWHVSTTDTGLLSEKIASLAVLLTEADSAWILTVDANQPGFILRACQNVPEAMQSKLNLPYEDDLSSLTRCIQDRLFPSMEKRSNDLQDLEWIGAALSVPVIQNGKVSAIITAARNDPQPFTASQQAMLELAAEYAWILLENAGRFHRMEQSLVYLKQANYSCHP